MKILVVDDDRAVAQSFCEILKIHGHEVRVAGSAAEAIREIKKGFAPDRMLLDVNLPDVLGDNLFEYAKNAGVSLPPAVAITGDNPSDHNLPQGVPILQKPADVDEVVRILESGVPESSGGGMPPKWMAW